MLCETAESPSLQNSLQYKMASHARVANNVFFEEKDVTCHITPLILHFISFEIVFCVKGNVFINLLQIGLFNYCLFGVNPSF